MIDDTWTRLAQAAPGAAIMLAAFVESFIGLGLILNGLALFGIAAYAYGSGLLSLPAIWICALVGAIAGDQSSYWLGRVGGPAVLRRKSLERRKVAVARAQALVEKYGWGGVVIGRFVLPLRSVVPLLCGALGMNAKRFAVANSVACIVWVSVWCVVLRLVVGALAG